MSEVEVVRAPALGGLPHGFLGRRGGVSRGAVAGLNVGYGSKDEREAIDENRRRALSALKPGAELVTVHQVHSPDVTYAEQAWPSDERPHVDAMVTDRPGLLLGILTADCAPVLLADPEAGVIGAAHAGWRGALGGVTDSVLAAMERLGARRSRIAAAIGPCIAPASYEVDTQFRDRFLIDDRDNERFFSGAPGEKPHFDLAGYVADRLRRAEVGTVDALQIDTYSEPDRFFSFRRATHRGVSDYGRQLSAIALP
ncbi:purine-nucleoside/S-methyl-5'-thioadenosine phosphorylase / adenosine deaminase [Sphingomonas sp. F9_3S_D5_B_2]